MRRTERLPGARKALRAPRFAAPKEEYAQCRDAAFAMEPNAGVAMLLALQEDGESLHHIEDRMQLERELFFYEAEDAVVRPAVVLFCDRLEGRLCRGVFADDTEHGNVAALLPPASLSPPPGAGSRIVLRTDKSGFVLTALSVGHDAVPFVRIGPAAWEAILPASLQDGRSGMSGPWSMSALFQGPDMGDGGFRKLVWCYYGYDVFSEAVRAPDGSSGASAVPPPPSLCLKADASRYSPRTLPSGPPPGRDASRLEPPTHSP